MIRSLAFAALVALSALLALSRATELLDLHTLDLQFRVLRTWLPRPAPEVVIVGIDHESMERIPEPMALWHRHLGNFLSALVSARPAVVGVDIVLPDRSYESIAPNTDKLLIRGLLDARRSYPMVLGLTVDPAGTTRKVHPPFIGVAGPDSTGYALFPLDRDGVVRRFDEHLAEGGAPIPTLAGQMARRLGKSANAGYIDYSRGAPYEYIPLHRVLDWIERDDAQALEHAFRGKPVLLGMIDRFNDRRPVAAQLAAWEADASDMPGVLINAQALRNMLDTGFAQRIDQAWIALAAAVAASAWFISAGTVSIVLVACALALSLLALSTALLAQAIIVPVMPVVLPLVLGLGLRHAWDTAGRLAERRRLRASFGGYVSPSVMEEILAGHLQPELGGVEKFVCVLFSDIRGYTT
ncbi:MAG: CHASE2 domain-containing protein, partial [Betaproteobacteria bacterium]